MDGIAAVRRQSRLVGGGVRACFFLSGAAGLVYEIAWMRMLGLVFGHTVFAVTTVLAAFMAGLALGAFLLGRYIDHRGRPLRVYGFLEAGIGVSCLLVPFALAQGDVAYVALAGLVGFSSFAFGLAQFALVFLILLVPTTLMGASLPVLSKFFVARMERLGRNVADLYALNTFGAVLGSAAAGFLLLPAIGVQATTRLAAAVNLAIGAWALVADGWARKHHEISPANNAPAVQAEDSDPPPTRPGSAVIWLVLAGTALSGAASMIYEVAWTRALSLVVGSSVYAFSAMLTTFLTGLAVGGFLFARLWGERRVVAALFGYIELAIGLSALVLVPVFERMPELVLAIFKRFSPSAEGALLVQFGLSFLVMIVPTTAIGAAFPCAVRLCTRILSRVGQDVGRVYSVNTVGTIFGALLGGFLLVPWFGAQTSMMAAAAVNVAVGALALLMFTPSSRIWLRAAVVSLLILFAAGEWLLPRWDRRLMAAGVSVYAEKFTSQENPTAGFREDAAARQLLYYRDGINSTVAVEVSNGTTALRVGGKVDASNGMDMMTQLMLGHLPVFLHARPARALAIGLGSGVTAGALAQHDAVREIDVVELEPAVAEAARFFARENRGVLVDPRVRLVIGDGRSFILAGDGQYDIITSEPSNPWMAGVANLFSLDFYRLARRRLATDGIMVQWLHGYSLFPSELKMIVNTFKQVFPHSTLWRTMAGDYLLVGTSSPLRVDYALVEQRMSATAATKEDMATLHLDSPLDLLTYFYLSEDDLTAFAAGAAVNTDDRPLLEFAAPLALYAHTVDLNAQLIGAARTAEFPPTANVPAGLLEQRRLHFAKIYWARGDKTAALEQLRKAPAPDPADSVSRLERCKVLFSLGEFAQASEELAQLADLAPQDRLVASYQKAGAILSELNAAEAVAQHGQTQYGDPNPAEAQNNLGVFYTRLGVRFGEPAFFDLSADALEAALRIEPQSYAVLNNLANAYFELGKLDDAGRVYRRVIEIAPGAAEARFNLGLVYEMQGHLDQATVQYQAAAAVRPAWELPAQRLRQLRESPPTARTGAPLSAHGDMAERGQ